MTPLEQLQLALFTVYENNMKYLNLFEKDLYEKINNLSHKIDCGEYQPQYELEFNEKEGYFDIFDINNKSFLYNTNSNKHAVKVARNIENIKNEFNNIDTNAYGYKDIDSFREIYKDTVELEKLERFIEDICEYNTFLLSKKTKNNEYKKLNKFIFLGTLLSKHIHEIHKKIKAEEYLIIEENLELFRLSLFTLDYFELSKESEVFFAVDLDNKKLKERTIDFLEKDPDYNYNIKFFSINNYYYKYNEVLAEAMYSKQGYKYNFGYAFNDYKLSLTNIKNNYKYLYSNDFELSDDFLNRPILILGAGPSLNLDMEWLKNNYNKFIIVAVSATVKKLYKNNIQPQIICSIDGSDLSVNQLDINDDKYFEDIILISNVHMKQKVLDKFKKENIYMVVNDTISLLDNDSFSLQGKSVGDVTYDFALSLGFKNIYLLGLDMAIDLDTGNTHDNEYVDKKLDISTYDEEYYLKSSGINASNLEKIEGNMQEFTYTNRTFKEMLVSINSINSKKKEEQNCFNLSKKGAKIDNSISILANELDLEPIDRDISNLIEQLEDNSFRGFNIEFCEKLENDISILTNILKKIETFKLLETSNKKNLASVLKSIMQYILKPDTLQIFEVRHVFLKYAGTINMYLNWYLYNKNTKFTKEELEKIKNIYINQISIIINDFIDLFKKALS